MKPELERDPIWRTVPCAKVLDDYVYYDDYGDHDDYDDFHHSHWNQYGCSVICAELY